MNVGSGQIINIYFANVFPCKTPVITSKCNKVHLFFKDTVVMVVFVLFIVCQSGSSKEKEGKERKKL